MSTEDMKTQAAPQNPMQVFRGMLEGTMKAEIAKALPKDIDPDRFIRTVITVVQMNPALLDADRRSLFGSCMRAAQDGLIPDGREAVLNIYNTKAKGADGRDVWVPTVQYLPMVRGILKIMRNTGDVLKVDAAAVYEKDQFAFKRGDDPKIEHEPYLGADDPGQIIAAYVIVKLENGEIQREVMPRRDIEKVRAASKSGDGVNSPWTKWYDQMAIKGVIKRVAKLLPSSYDRLDRVIQHDNEAMGFEFNQRGTEVTALQETVKPRQLEVGKSSRLAAIVGSAGLSQTVSPDVKPDPVMAETETLADGDGSAQQKAEA